MKRFATWFDRTAWLCFAGLQEAADVLNQDRRAAARIWPELTPAP